MDFAGVLRDADQQTHAVIVDPGDAREPELEDREAFAIGPALGDDAASECLVPPGATDPSPAEADSVTKRGSSYWRLPGSCGTSDWTKLSGLRVCR